MADIGSAVHVIGLAGSAAGLDFGSQVQEWSAFFSSVAQVSGGLVGLVFVALTFNARMISGADTALRDLARQTFADFLNVLVVSLSFLVPHTAPDNVGIIVVILGAMGIYRISRSLLAMFHGRAQRLGSRHLIQRFLLSMSGNIGLLVAGAMLMSDQINYSVFWSTLFASILGLLLSGSRSAWHLVMPGTGDRAS